MTKEEFDRKYGRLHIRRKIGARVPVVPGKASADPNRKLMIKFKYNDLNQAEEYLFHENIKNLIYKVMHTNNVMMDWEDVYQEIWKKISRCKYGWKEFKGTYVSTWITIVANSVINTLRTRVKRRNARFCLYDDIGLEDVGINDTGAMDKGDAVEEFFNKGDALIDQTLIAGLRQDDYQDFLKSLDPIERRIMDAIHERQEEIVDGFERRNTQAPIQLVRQSLGYDESTFTAILACIYQKYCDICNRGFLKRHAPPGQDDDSSSEEGTLF